MQIIYVDKGKVLQDNEYLPHEFENIRAPALYIGAMLWKSDEKLCV